MALTQISTKGIKDGTITGTDLATNVDLVDNQKLRLGTSQDLQIYHDGSHSFIDNDTGHLTVTASQINLNNQDNSENCATLVGNGAVNLFFNGSKKFETKSDGVLVTGELQATTLDINGNGHIDGTLQLTNDLFLGDNDEINIGSSNDLKIYHDGSNSYINNDTQYLQIQSSYGVLLQRHDGSENLLRALSNAAVELYYDGSKKLETTSTGVQVSGRIDITGTGTRIDIADNGKIILGDSNDMQIFHSGSHSFIKDAGTGQLVLNTNALRVNNADDSDNMITADELGAVKLFFADSKKLETKNTGVSVTGQISSTGSIFIDDGTNARLSFAPNSATNARILATTTGFAAYTNLEIRSSTVAFKNAGNTQTMTLDASGNLGIGTTSPSRRLNLNIGGDQTWFQIDKSRAANEAMLQLVHTAGNRPVAIRFANSQGSWKTGMDGTEAYVLASGATDVGDGTARMTLDSSGNIGAPSGTNIFNASDSRVKTNVVDLNKGLTAIKSLRPVSFNWIDGFCDKEKNTLYGFIAQEVNSVDSNLIQDFATELTINENKIENVLRVNEKFIIPMLVKAIQELSAKIETLETKVAALEAS